MTSAPAASTETHITQLIVRDLGVAEYQTVWEAMRRFTETRTPLTPDELWLVEHPPVYTLGTNDRREPFANPAGIPVIQTDRGGQITYHGPGQLIAYVLLDLRRRGLGVKQLVHLLEAAVIELLHEHRINGERRAGAPGVYVAGRKLAQLGLRVRQRGSYHGLSLNVAMDHAPFRQIKPCGYAGLETTDLKQLCGAAAPPLSVVKEQLVAHLRRQLDAIGRESNTIAPMNSATIF